MSDTQAVEVVRSMPDRSLVSVDQFMPLFTVEQAVNRKAQINQFIGSVLVENEDYGPMPGDNRKDKKKVLLKPGAEKLCSIFGLAPRYVKETVIEDWTGAEHGGEPLFYYEYRCQLYRGEIFMGEAIGSANTWEAKHRYRWVKAEDVPGGDITGMPSRTSNMSEFVFAIDKAETSGPYGKPAAYWDKWKAAITSGEARKMSKTTSKGKELDAYEMGGTLYRIPNPDAADLVNTCQKMAQKRAQVAAVLVVTNCSDAFTQDMDDDPRAGVDDIDTGGHPVGTQAAADHVAKTKIAEAKAEEVPLPLKALFANLDKPGYISQGWDLLKNGLIEAMPAEGESSFRKILESHGIKKGNREATKNDVMKAMREVYDLTQWANDNKPKPYQATDADLPPFDTLSPVPKKDSTPVQEPLISGGK